jgi:hypothetical protein
VFPDYSSFRRCWLRKIVCIDFVGLVARGSSVHALGVDKFISFVWELAASRFISLDLPGQAPFFALGMQAEVRKSKRLDQSRRRADGIQFMLQQEKESD